MTMKQFGIAAQAAHAVEDIDGQELKPLSFQLPAKPNPRRKADAPVRYEEYTAQAPKGAQLAFLIASASNNRTDSDRVAAILDFLEQVLEEPGKTRLRRRMLDREDPLELTDVMPIFQWMVEEWGGQAPS